jgi:hypothetical protein
VAIAVVVADGMVVAVGGTEGVGLDGIRVYVGVGVELTGAGELIREGVCVPRR